MSASAQGLLAFDFGLKRIGVAVGQTLLGTASPLTVLNADDGQPEWTEIERLIAQWQPSALVVGLPLNMDGSEQPLTERARTFAAQLGERSGLAVHFADERLTTREARQRAGPGRSSDPRAQDAVAAQVILEGWMRGARL